MEVICSKEKCTGCGLCAAECTKGAIKIVLDGIHYYPKIDKQKCIDCGLCQKQCIVEHPVELYTPIKCYAAWSKDSKEHFECASGGVSTVLAKHFIEKGGYVAGCIWDEKIRATTLVTNKLTDIERFKKSKYVHNYFPADTYHQIKQLLQDGNLVLFIGVPCQCAAIKRYCKKYDENLVVVDLLCHGGASPRLFANYLASFSQKYGPIKNVTFRGGADDCNLCLYGEKNQLLYKGGQFEDPYFWSFMRHTLYRRACFSCLFAQTSRPADLTLADFWGLDNAFIEKHALQVGVNLIISHTKKGEELLKAVQNKVECYERELNEAVGGNETLQRATPKPLGYDLLNWAFTKFKSLKFCCWAFDLYFIRAQSLRIIKTFVKKLLPRFVIVKLKKYI